MIKVGIVTWHYIDNYGSALQAYALQQAVSRLGFCAHIIDYRKGADSSVFKKYLRGIPFVLRLKRKYLDRKRPNSFCAFHDDFFNLSKMYSSYEKLRDSEEQYDIYICGSDQIWSPNLLDPVYLLNFVQKGCKKIAYAPSLVIDDFSQEQKELFRKHVKDINFISVREQKGAEIVKKITGLDAEVVLDPTFLLTSKEWENIIIESEKTEKYILCYFLGQNRENRELVKWLQKEYKCKIRTLPFNKEDMHFGDIIEANAGPREFLGLLKNAEIICTDSFHGISLSINFEKSFLACERFKKDDVLCQNDRIYNILTKLNLTDRIISNSQGIENIDLDINYKSVKELLNKERDLSIDFLRKALMQ